MPARRATSIVVVFTVVVFTCAAVAVPAHAAGMALVPVSASGPHTIVGDEIILHGADQIVTLEVRISDWNPARIKGYQANIDPLGSISGDAGTLMPLGWDNPGWTDCATDTDCPPGRVCYNPWGTPQGYCAGPNHHPETGAFIDEGRWDYVFHGLSALAGVDLTVWDASWADGFRYGALTLSPPGEGVVYVPPARYGGTLTLVVPSDAAGTFTMRLHDNDEGDFTFLADEHGQVIHPYPTLTPALITVIPAECGNGICDSGEDAASCPEDCGPGPIPAVSTWGLTILGLLLATLAKLYYARPRKRACPA